MGDNINLEWALWYASQGWPVFPLKIQGKTPATRNGFKNATTDEAQIRQWWGSTPNYNIGIPTGAVSGLDVIDFDLPNGGGETYQKLVETHGALPTTLVCKTPNGWHCYFQHEEGFKNTSGKIGAGVDTRGDGGYVVVPPSTRGEEGCYYWDGGAEIPIAKKPVWINGYLQARPAEVRVVVSIGEQQRRYISKVLDSECASVSSSIKGGRNNALNIAACKLGAYVAGGCLPQWEAEGRLLDAALSCGLPEQEARATIKSGLKAGEATPKQVPKPQSPAVVHHKPSAVAEPVEDKDYNFNPINAMELLSRDFPEPKWVVPEILPSGLCVIGGAPKIGKSWMALSICKAIACGGYAFSNYLCEQGPVLYAALEDTYENLQERLKLVLHGETPDLSGLTFVTEMPLLNNGGIECLEAYMDKTPDARLVVIDTLAHVKPQASRNLNAYDADTYALKEIKKFAASRNIAVIVVTHLTKQKPSDPVEQISGSMAITGMADTLWVVKRTRGEIDASLIVTGKRTKEQNIALEWDEVCMLWNYMGDASEFSASREQRDVMECIDRYGVVSVNDLVDELDLQRDAAKKRLSRMCKEGKIERKSYGKYGPINKHSHLVTLAPKYTPGED